MKRNNQYLLKLISEISAECDKKSEKVDKRVSASIKNRIPGLFEFFKLTKDDEVIILAYIINNSLLNQDTSTEMILDNCYNKKISEWPKIIRVTSLLQQRCLIGEKLGGRTAKKTISKTFYAEQATLNAVIKGNNSYLKNDEIVNFDDFVEAIKRLFTKRRTHTIEYSDLEKEVLKIFSKHKKQFDELQWIESLRLSAAEIILLFVFIIHKVEDDGDYHYEKEVKQIYMTKDRMYIRTNLSNSSHTLISKGVIYKDGDEMFESIKLSEHALQRLFPQNRDLVYKPKLGKIIHYSQIKAEELFYNPAEKKQVEMIKNGLSNHNYNRIVNKLKKYGEESLSFNALLYGSPGCGKTSSVYQIARATKRNVYFVEVTSILSKYVGETEKLITQLFRDYNEWNKTQENTGILLINEIDTIFSKRVHVNGSNDQFSNQIVTTFLQEIELCRDGIVMATTNCTDLDPALDRRFLFKVRFDKPIEEVSSQIIENKLNIKGIKIDTKVLKNKQLTGAQIQNLKQKIIIKNITEGTTTFSDQLHELVEEELSLSKHQTKTVIGFK